MTPDEAMAALLDAAGKYHEANKIRKEKMSVLAEAMLAADEAGVPRSQIQKGSGLALATVYRTLGDGK